MNRTTRTFVRAILLLGVAAGGSFAQVETERVYTIGVGDLLRVSVWQEPTLNREVEVGIDGLVVLPLVGSIRAAGHTPSALAAILTDRYSLYKRDISQVEVVVIEFNSREIFVIGEIGQPGRYTFQEIPDLWTVIMEAGGPTTSAFLSEVRILRGEGESMRTITIDLNAYLLGGDREALPRLQPGDTVYIPRTSVLGADFLADRVVYVFGEVVRPGTYLVGANENLVGALLLAGGITPTGDRGRVRIVRDESGQRVVTEVNIEDYTKRGDLRGNPILRAGDTIEVARDSETRLRTFFDSYGAGLRMVSTVLTFVYLYDRLVDNR
ncbi:MAG: polysaccharide biosynthesis/export family protein [Candidatus Eisenbacteria bacterium]|nr:polysaccharide biosynthesis/export family protein [Candidatus Eisenbacteria bacterium]